MDIKLTSQDKKYINNPDDVFSIMQRILLRENNIDIEKEHFWIIGLNLAGYILYIELIALGSVREVPVEPMNVYRVAVMKNATRVIAVHNHPTGRLAPSDADKDITDRLIQVGRILNIEMEDHLIISPTSYQSFKAVGLMQELGDSVKYVPSYQLIERIRKEEKAIAKDALKAEKDKAAEEKRMRAQVEQQLTSAVHFLQEKNISVEEIAAILSVSPAEVKKIVRKKTKDPQ